MGAAPVRSGIRHRPLLLAAALSFSMLTFSVSASATAAAAQVDRLWTQPDGLRVDSSFYVIQTWWEGMGRAAQRDLSQRALAELQQANTDLLNAYSLLVEERNDPGPHPVAVIDPLLSGLYSIVTGEHPKAPLGSLFHWVNQQLLKLEGRGSSEAIVDHLLRDYRQLVASADRDFESSGAADVDGLWAANADRGKAVLARIKGLGIKSDGLSAALTNSEQVRAEILKKRVDRAVAGGSFGQGQVDQKGQGQRGQDQKGRAGGAGPIH